MCWSSNKNPIPQIAEKDIEVLKICRQFDFQKSNDCASSYYASYLYRIDVETTRIPLKVNKRRQRHTTTFGYIINEGYHSYDPDKVKLNIDKFGDVKVICYDEVEGEYCDLGYFSRFPNLVKLLCIIPKGTTYYENVRGEIVSECIKPIKIEKI